MKKRILTSVLFASSLLKPFIGFAATDLSLGDSAPSFSVKTHEGTLFNLESRKGKWTVLYFYPKADTPGCTKQACAFRDNIKKITDVGADVYGISVNSVNEQAQFHKKYKLLFTLLADEDGKVATNYGAKMPVVNMSKRWTFIIDPQLKIRSIRKDIDPASDAQKVAEEIIKLKSSAK